MQASLYLQFEQQALQTPNAPCLSDGEQTINYKESLHYIDAIAQQLYSKGVRSGSVVALYCEKNINAVPAFLAISRLGAVTLTLDTSFPVNMLEFILEDANVQWVLCQNAFPIDTNLPKVALPKPFDPVLSCEQQRDCPKVSSGQNIAWIVYSSGTTGQPKGIELSHQAILSSIFSRYQISPYETNDRVACCIYFFWEIFRPLFRGACAYVLSDKTLLDTDRYRQYIEQNQITETLWTPSFAQILMQCVSEEILKSFSSLKRIWLNGEVVCNKLANDLLTRLPNIQFINLYSISETYDIAAMPLTKNALSDSGFASIGTPLAGVEAWVLDEDKKICPINTPGELYISSPFLARGYLNRHDLNQQSFLELDDVAPGKRLFKTKDTACQTSSGEIVLFGRNDHIVKLRGYNVSLLAIEDVIKRALPIDECIVKVEGDNPVSQKIVAAIKAQDPIAFHQEFDLDVHSGLSKTLQTVLSHHLPSYAIPSQFRLIDTLKLNQYSAKLERKSALDAIQNGFYATTFAGNTNVEKLKTIWQDVLDVPSEQIHEESDFFSLGGNSLQAMQLTHRCNQTFTAQLDLTSVYQYTRFAQQIRLLGGENLQSDCIQEQILQDIAVSYPKPPGMVRHPNLKTAQHVLMTGATGFLGAHWLASCLMQTDSSYVCLIRANSQSSAMSRLVSAFEAYHLDTSLLQGRVKALTGSLTETRFGLDPLQWETLSQEIDVILHAAATVNLLYPYHRVKATMVDGTHTLLKLATTHHLKPITMISSDAVYAKQAIYNSQDFLGTDSLKDLTSGYAQAKWAKEQLIKKAATDCGLPYLIVRLGNLSPSLATGASNANDANKMLMQAIQKHKAIPESLHMEFTPVDSVAYFLAQRCLQQIDDSIMSITDFNKLDANKLLTLLSDQDFKIVKQDKWLDILQQHEPQLYTLWQTGADFSDKEYRFEHESEREKQKGFFSLPDSKLQRTLELLRQQNQLRSINDRLEQ